MIEKRKHAEFIKSIRDTARLSQRAFGKSLGVSGAYIGQVETGEVPLSEKVYNNIISKYGNLANDKLMQESCIEIPYFEVKGSCGSGALVCCEPIVRSIRIDGDLIAKVLRRKPENLHIIEATGDSMEGDNIFEKDVLLIDTSSINPLVPGIYVFTTQNNELVFIKRLYLRPDGILDVISSNKKYTTLHYTASDMEKLTLSIKGRVIKNLSRGL